MKKITLLFILLPCWCAAQKLSWINVDTLYPPAQPFLHVYYTDQKIDSAPFRAYYVEYFPDNKKLEITTDTSKDRRLTPRQYFDKNNGPLVVVNGTFFSFETNRNLNVVIREKKLLAYNTQTVNRKVGDSTIRVQVFGSAIGFKNNNKPDIAWIYTDSSEQYAKAWQEAPGVVAIGDQLPRKRKKWKMRTAIGGGPVLIQDGEIRITNNEEFRFPGKAINDKHPRTAMGYTRDNRLIILVIEGRNPDAGGATLLQEAQILKDLGCVEALNLDGGGSSCLLVNGKETIKPAGSGQRPVPAVLIIKPK